uniref:Ig-like domain-containing protein n=1 Tax=Seriola lalandi dorsalis TaxID=1841481 RepID=A0A3B4XSS2_SERLL
SFQHFFGSHELCKYKICSCHAVGVHGSCPIELNPLSVVVRYGDAVSVNCSTSETMFDGMGWEVTEGGISPKKVNHLTWSVKNLKNWDISPQCFLNPSPETFPEQVSISSSSGLMREEEEYNFTCHIQHVAPVQNLTVRWYKEDTLIRTDTFNNTSKKPVDQSSVYSFTAKRQDNGVTLRCEAHMDLGPEGPQFDLSSQAYNITVHCKYLEDAEVEVGSNVSLKCSSMSNPRPQYIWNYYRTDNVMEENEDGVSRLLIINATAYNSGSYTCRTFNEIGEVSKTARVTVKSKVNIAFDTSCTDIQLVQRITPIDLIFPLVPPRGSHLCL